MRPSLRVLPLASLVAAVFTFAAAGRARSEPPILQLHKDKGVAPHPGLDPLYWRFSKAYLELDAEAAAGVYADDAQYLIPGEELRSGRASVRESFAAQFQQSRKDSRQLFLTFGIVQRRVEGSLAYDVGYGNLSVTGKDGYSSVGSFKFVVVARRTGKDDASWRWQVDSFSGLHPPRSAAATAAANGASNMEKDLEKQVGSAVTLRGTARDAKGGAVLVLASGEPIYLRGLHAWPQAVQGKAVQVSGVLKKEQYLPEAVTTPGGAVSQGTAGLQWTLDKPTFQPAPQ